MRAPLRLAAAAVTATALAMSAAALGQQTVTDHGVALTLHVALA